MSKQTDLITGVIMALFSAAYIYEATTVKVFGGMGKAVINSGTIPKIWGGCLLVLSIVLIVRGLRNKVKNIADAKKMSVGELLKDKWEVLATFILLTIYIALMDYAGFIISSFIYLFIQIIILTPSGKRNYKLAGVLALVFSVSIYYVFVEWLMVLLPAGILG